LTLIGIETLTVGGSAINWFDEVSTQIVNTQNADGSWPTTSYEGGESSQVLTTAWALLVLERAVGEAPAPASAGLAAPALSAFGLMVLTALLAMVGTWLVRERSRRGSDLIG